MLRRIFLFIFWGMMIGASAQDIHVAGVADMKTWYNPSLKTDQRSLVYANIRSVSYQNVTAYTSKAATLELPVIMSKSDDEQDEKPFMNIALGITASGTTGGTVNVSAAMLGLSYALPVDRNRTFIAVGFQVAYTFSRVTTNGYNVFPDKFDLYGPVSSAILTDPYGLGYTYQYLTAGTGVTVFHNGKDVQWYIGGSARHINRPLTDPAQPGSYRLPVNTGIQAGYAKAVTAEDKIGGYVNFMWQDGTHEDVVGALYTRSFNDSARNEVSLGMGYRAGDALMPGVGFKTGSNHFNFCYEFPVGGQVTGNYRRRAFEFAYTLDL